MKKRISIIWIMVIVIVIAFIGAVIIDNSHKVDFEDVQCSQ